MKQKVKVNITELTNAEAIKINMKALLYKYPLSIKDFFENFGWNIFWNSSNLLNTIAEVVIFPFRIMLWSIAYLIRTMIFLIMYLYLVPYYVIRALLTLRKAKKENWQGERIIYRKISEEVKELQNEKNN